MTGFSSPMPVKTVTSISTVARTWPHFCTATPPIKQYFHRCLSSSVCTLAAAISTSRMVLPVGLTREELIERNEPGSPSLGWLLDRLIHKRIERVDRLRIVLPPNVPMPLLAKRRRCGFPLHREHLLLFIRQRHERNDTKR